MQSFCSWPVCVLSFSCAYQPGSYNREAMYTGRQFRLPPHPTSLPQIDSMYAFIVCIAASVLVHIFSLVNNIGREYVQENLWITRLHLPIWQRHTTGLHAYICRYGKDTFFTSTRKFHVHPRWLSRTS